MAKEQITSHGVLIITSLANMSTLVGSMLRSLGRRDIRDASTATDAMSELRRRVFDIIIIDEDLETVDAVEFIRKLRACTDCDNRHTPVIMMSAAPDVGRIAAARDAGVTEFLRKPFAANHLQARIDSIEKSPRAFIESTDFAGPDRRRKSADRDTPERRKSAGLPKAV